MPLIDIWKANPTAVEQMSIEQIVATAGNGRLTDHSQCSAELRLFLQQVSSDAIARYIEYCLSNSFSKSGFVLQDLVNELGRRLDYDVQNGLYQGRSNTIGQDGLWASPEDHHLVIEVKTTDAFRISLEIVANYKKRLIAAGEVDEPVSILIVVGRQDTGDLEAQVRGSRHAWDVRLISADALVKLVQIKESTEEPNTLVKIRGLLIPVEYTRVDQLIDVLFTAAKDVEAAVESEQDLDLQGQEEKKKRHIDITDRATLQTKRQSILSALERQHDVRLIKKTRATYWDSLRSVRVVCTISKRYEKAGQTSYWYAYHPSWDEFLEAGDKSFFVLGCVDLNIAFAIPQKVLQPLLPNLNTTEKDDGTMKWHIKIVEEPSGDFFLWIPKQPDNLSLNGYIVQLLQTQTV